MRNKVRLGVGAGLAATAVLTVAGCSGSGGSGTTGNGNGNAGSVSGSAISLVADAMNKATTAGTVKIAGTISGTVSGQSVSMTMSGQEQYSPTLEMSMTMQTEGQNISEILLGQKVYMQYPGLSAELGGKPWAEIDLSQSTGSLGALSSIIDSARNENPTAQLSAMVASKQITKVGTETVQGQQTTHYNGTLNASQFLQSGAVASQLTPAQLATLKSMLQTGGVTTETIDLWIASNGLPVQLKEAVHTGEGVMNIDMTTSDWGAPVQVSAPPSSQTTDITAMVNSAMASASAS